MSKYSPLDKHPHKTRPVKTYVKNTHIKALCHTHITMMIWYYYLPPAMLFSLPHLPQSGILLTLPTTHCMPRWRKVVEVKRFQWLFTTFVQTRCSNIIFDFFRTTNFRHTVVVTEPTLFFCSFMLHFQTRQLCFNHYNNFFLILLLHRVDLLFIVVQISFFICIGFITTGEI